jgi:hypothetical protein
LHIKSPEFIEALLSEESVPGAIPYCANNAGNEHAEEYGRCFPQVHAIDFGINERENFKEGVVNTVRQCSLAYS